MANRIKRICRADGCGNLTADKCAYCDQHRYIFEEKRAAYERKRDQRRPTATQRGYDARWARYAKWFLSLPEHRLCALRLDDRCAIVAQCVDHIDPPDGPNDPRFWDYTNHQAACIHCNSKKNHSKIVGEFRLDFDPIKAPKQNDRE